MHEKIREGFDVFLHDGEKSFGAVYSDGPGQPPPPARLMAGFRS